MAKQNKNNTTNNNNSGEIIIYKGVDGAPSIEVRVEDETVCGSRRPNLQSYSKHLAPISRCILKTSLMKVN